MSIANHISSAPPHRPGLLPFDMICSFPSQWPEEEDVPGFKKTYLRYLGEVENLGYEFVQLVAEALGLPPDGLVQFYDVPERMQHRSKVRFVLSFFLLRARVYVFFFFGGGGFTGPVMAPPSGGHHHCSIVDA
jgi:hypothetical protein